MIEKLKEYKETAAYLYGQARTALAAIAGLLVLLGAQGVLSGKAEDAAQIVISVAVALGVYRVKDDPTDEQQDALIDLGREIGRN